MTLVHHPSHAEGGGSTLLPDSGDRVRAIAFGPQQSRDAATSVVIGAVFFAIALVSLWLPAQRVAAPDPTAALREF